MVFGTLINTKCMKMIENESKNYLKVKEYNRYLLFPDHRGSLTNKDIKSFIFPEHCGSILKNNNLTSIL